MWTPKQRLKAVLNGEKPDRVPFAPFAELIPRSQAELEFRNLGMGFIQHYSSVRSSCPIRQTVNFDGGSTNTVYHTSFGEMSTSYQYVPGASNDGSVQTGFLIKEEEDYRKAIEYIDSISFSVDHSGDELVARYLGEEGVTHAWADEPPYMGAQYYMGLEKWTYDQYDCPQLFQELLDALGRLQDRRIRCLEESAEDMINLGNLAGNFSPAAFEKYMVPYFAEKAQALHRRGKKVTVHADASNLSEYKHLILPCQVDIVEAFTPPPVGNLSLAEARKAWGDQITILINFPETVFYGGFDATKEFTKQLILSDPCPNKIIGLTEMGFVGATSANVDRIETGMRAILAAIEEVGSYQS